MIKSSVAFAGLAADSTEAIGNIPGPLTVLCFGLTFQALEMAAPSRGAVSRRGPSDIEGI
jgi:hypothetical protein